ncbi:MAG: triose-phosphate isomerase [Candidatus Liptonbacteria bacterium]|nr:triose-phosphate isomerase [Candidatus Liptonbacteria bacterium]
MKKLIVANWKMNPDSFSRAELLVRAVQKTAASSKNAKVVLCLPYPWLTDISHKKHKGLSFGAQNVFWENSGAYTGEVSPAMLKNSGVEYVIIGHSERRKWLGETDEMINKRVKAALKTGLKVILCVGEGIEIRKKGLSAAKKFVKNQLQKDLKNFPSSKLQALSSYLVIAYEPVWAIGTGKADKPEDTVEMAKFIKSLLAAKPYTLNPNVLYGGSVTFRNAGSLLQYKEINGALVGGASIKSKEFIKIIRAAG